MKQILFSALLLFSSLIIANDKASLADIIYNNDLDSLKELIISKENANSFVSEKKELTILAYAASLGYKDICTFLINMGADIMWHNNSNSVLHSAAYGGMTIIVADILNTDSTLCNLQDAREVPPIVYAAEKDNIDCLKLLLSYGANYKLETAFNNALLNNNFAIAQLLVDRGISIKGSVNSKKDSPIFKTLIANNLEAASFLIKNGIDINKPLIINGKTDLNLFYNSLIRRNSDFSIFCLENNTNFYEDLIVSSYQASDTMSPFLYILKLKNLNRFNDWAKVASLFLKNAAEKGIMDTILKSPEKLFDYLTLKNYKTILFDLLFYTNDGNFLINTKDYGPICLIEYLNKTYPELQIKGTPYIDPEKKEFTNAVISGKKRKVKSMLKQRPEFLSTSLKFVNYKEDTIYDDPFDCSVYAGQLDLAKYLYKKDISFNGPGIHDLLYNSACQQDNYKMVNFLIKKDRSFEKYGKWKLYSNMDASPDIISLMIKKGVDPDEFIFNGQSFLFYIVRSNNTDAIDIFIDNSKVIDKNQKKLIKAIEYNNHNLVNKQLKKNTDVNFITTAGLTPLCWAAYFNRNEIAKELIDHGACINISERTNNNINYPVYGSSPLRWSIFKGDTAIVRLLIKNEAIPFIYLFLEENQNVFHYAACKNQSEIMDMLIKAYGNNTSSLKSIAGIDEKYLMSYYDYNDVGIYNNLSATPFDIAAYHGYEDIYQEFLDLGLGVDNLNKASRNYYTPLYFAIRGKQFKTAEYFIKLGSDITSTNQAELLLTEAINNGTPEIIELLVNNGIAENLSKEFLSQSLLKAAYYQNTAVIKTLIDLGADINVVDKDSCNLFDKIIESNRFSDKKAGCEYLIEKGLNINQYNKNGITALHLAAQKNNLELVTLLLHDGAKPNLVGIKNSKEKTPIDLAENYIVYKELKKYGGVPANYLEK